MKDKKQNQRISTSKKNANNKKWYEEKADLLDKDFDEVKYGYGDISEYKRLKVNYDLNNNILDLKDFEYVCRPFGAEAGELPARMINRDIVSGKIKSVLGMEMNRPFSWQVVATNPEATTRREQEQASRIRQFVVEQITLPIKQQIELKYQEQLKGKKLSEQEVQQIQQQIEQEVQAQTPDEVKKYMEREYQDPAEAMSEQLLTYLIQKTDARRKFNKVFKHGLLSGEEVMYSGILNGEPEIWVVNTMDFNGDYSSDNQFAEDGEYATCQYKMTPSEILKYFGDELTQEDIDNIYSYWSGITNTDNEDLFNSFDNNNEFNDNSSIAVRHCVWKSLRKIGFLTYIDEKSGEEQMILVDENYKINKDFGDVSIEWEWIPEVYETWKIKTGKPIYVYKRPLPGQFKDLDNLYNCKLPYYSVVYDNMNSKKTSLMDRLKVYQYYYNIVMYRLELLLASDKGKKVLMNIGAIPASSGIDVEKWQYFMESTPYMWYDPQEEGNTYNDANTIAKVIDLSLASDIQKYIEIAEYLRQQAGRSVGITEQVEGQISSRDAVRNTQQAIVQSANILEYYFDLHNYLKRNILQSLLENAKIAYSNKDKLKLTYILDDFSRQTLNVDMGLLDNSTLGIFISNSGKAEQIKQNLTQLAHAALQSQKIELSDVISIIKHDSMVEAEETLKVAEKNRKEYEQQMQQQQLQAQQQQLQMQHQRDREKFQEDIEKLNVEYDRKEKLEILKGAMVGASFNPDTDKDNDGINDYIEIAKHGLDADIKVKQQQLKEKEFEHKQKVDNKKLEQQDKKIKQEEAKLKAAKVKNT